MNNIPEIIIICEGGIIPQVITNTPVKLFNLDHDLFECDMDEPEYFEDREYGNIVDVLDQKKFEKTKAKIANDWNKDMDKHPSFIHDEADE